MSSKSESIGEGASAIAPGIISYVYFFDMTEDEKTYQILNQSRNNCSDSLDLCKEDTNSSIGPSLAHRTPPPPPKPSRKNSQKRTANNESGSDNHEDDFL